MSALTDRILAEHGTGGTDVQEPICTCGTLLWSYPRHIAEVTEAAVRAEQVDPSDLLAVIDRETLAQEITCDQRLDDARERFASIEKRLEALENAPSASVEPRTPSPEGQGTPETAETNSGARACGALGVVLDGHRLSCVNTLGHDGECAGYNGAGQLVTWTVNGPVSSTILGHIEALLDPEGKVQFQTRSVGQGHRHTRLTDTPDNGDITKPQGPWPTDRCDPDTGHCGLLEGHDGPCVHPVDLVRQAAQQLADITATPPVMVDAPKPGDVLTVEQLEMLPVGAKAKDAHGVLYTRADGVEWPWREDADPTAELTGTNSHEAMATWRGPSTLVSLPDPDEDEPTPEHQCRPPVISREEAEGLPEGSIVRCVEVGCVKIRHGDTWRSGTTGKDSFLCGRNLYDNGDILLLWHPEWGQS